MTAFLRFRTILAACLVACALASGIARADADKREVVERISAARLKHILNSLKLEFIESTPEDDTTLIKDKDVLLFLLINGEKSLSARVLFSDEPVSNRRLNEWNSKGSRAKAYFDPGRALWLSSTHTTSGGVTEKNIENWLKEYLSDLEAFKKHIARDEGARLNDKVSIGPIEKSTPTLVAIVHLSDKVGVILKWDSDALDKAGMPKVLQEPCGGLAAQKDVPLRDVLDKLLGPLGLTYRAERDQIVVVPAKKRDK